MDEGDIEQHPQNNVIISFDPDVPRGAERIQEKEQVQHYLKESAQNMRLEEFAFHQPDYLKQLIEEKKIEPERISKFLQRFDINIPPEQIVGKLRVNPSIEKYYELCNWELNANSSTKGIGSFNTSTGNIRFHTNTNQSLNGVIVHEATHSDQAIFRYFTSEFVEERKILIDSVEQQVGLQSAININTDQVNNLGVFWAEGVAFWLQKQYLLENEPDKVAEMGEEFSSVMDNLVSLYASSIARNDDVGKKLREVSKEAGLNPTDSYAFIKLVVQTQKDPQKHEQSLRTVVNTMFDAIDPDFYDTLLMIGREYVNQKPLAGNEEYIFEPLLNNLINTLIKYTSSNYRFIPGEKFIKQRQLSSLRKYLTKLKGY